MKVFWTETAVNHLSSIYTYIFQNSPHYAQRLVERLTQRSEQIAQFPLSGRIVPEFETKQIREVIEGSYRIIYYMKSINWYCSLDLQIPDFFKKSGI
ncbi:type II toxin-antitoxin system RelE/ParE family toxin [Nostoc sp. CHAB 5715]|uniref:type II toxin-antitoxin system RelE/ParE family toxin n=1 Tax=Nostoc sp. CHAB 5715 TaxID=2780400 RepID=UPI001E35D634|nr:type II toxin-antitoxin system RelE/ParE family toxin [Nostoc sp. CHAB 5715]